MQALGKYTLNVNIAKKKIEGFSLPNYGLWLKKKI